MFPYRSTFKAVSPQQRIPDPPFEWADEDDEMWEDSILETLMMKLRKPKQ
jgi:hypothetical protein